MADLSTHDISLTEQSGRADLLRKALLLSLLTIGYNLVEGIVSVGFGAAGDTLALFGFGVDSFVEVISGLGIAHMVIRMRKGSVEQRDGFERTALRITGMSFYLLSAGLLLGAGINAWRGIVPESSTPGIAIAILSLLTMYWLMKAKLAAGRALDSDAIIADANCTKTCFYLSAVLLLSSGLFAATGIGWFDQFGSLGIAWFAYAEGREALDKARSGSLSCGCHDSCGTGDRALYTGDRNGENG